MTKEQIIFIGLRRRRIGYIGHYALGTISGTFKLASLRERRWLAENAPDMIGIVVLSLKFEIDKATPSKTFNNTSNFCAKTFFAIFRDTNCIVMSFLKKTHFSRTCATYQILRKC